MKVVIPMSGMSRRFMDVGHTLPKYLLEIDGSLSISGGLNSPWRVDLNKLSKILEVWMIC